MREADFQTRLKRLLEGIGALVFNVHGHAMQSIGWPDLYVAHWKWSGWLELKVDHEPLREVQRIVLRELSKRRVPCFVLRLHVEEAMMDIVEINERGNHGKTWMVDWHETCKDPMSLLGNL